MTHPVENCHKYTAEQVDLRNLIYADTQFGYRGETDLKLVELQSLVTRGWMQEGDENNEFDVTDVGHEVIAVTLRQQADRGDGMVPDGWDGEAYANMAGELESWKLRALQAEHFIEHEVQGQTFMGEPLLRAPAEQGGRVDDGLHFSDAEDVAQWLYRNGQHNAAATVRNQLDVRNERIRELQAALAQNAQGEAVAWMCETVNGYTAFSRDGKFPCNAGKISPLYLHAERARVPEITDVLAHWVIASVGDVPYVTMTTEQVKAALRENLHLLAAPSQPEDAGEVDRG